MFERLKFLHATGRLTADGIAAAVTKGWISQAQADEILAEPAAHDNPDNL